MNRFAVLLIHLTLLGSLAQAKDEKPQNAPEQPAVKRPKVAVLVFPGVELLDFAGPSEAFAGATDEHDEEAFEVYTVGLTEEPVPSLSVVEVKPTYTVSKAPAPDILVIPGGNVVPVMDDENAMKWIEGLSQSKCIVFTVCNGASVAAKLGLLEGRSVTTHHSNMRILRLLDPKTSPRSDCRYVDHGKVITAAGVSAGIDAALYLIARTQGFDVAQRTATGMEYEHWVGFQSKDLALPSPDSHGVTSQPSREFKDDYSWYVLTLIEMIREKGMDAAVAAYPEMLEKTSGHEKEMIAEPGLTETAMWFLKHSRDQSVGLETLRFITLTHPTSSTAFAKYSEGLLLCERPEQAIEALKKACELSPENKELTEKRDELISKQGSSIKAIP
ncbi:MAG: DJ-1/PfpI family protein [Planctomycetaceae bacterium]|nr:DJ-1/PfpI family protein [Planctomycetaceae bacterium]